MKEDPRLDRKEDKAHYMSNSNKPNALPLLDREQQDRANTLPLLDREQQDRANTLPLLDREQQDRANALPLLDREQQDRVNTLPLLDKVPYVDEHGKDDDHLVAITFPVKSKKKKKQQHSDPVSVDDVFLSFKSQRNAPLGGHDAPLGGQYAPLGGNNYAAPPHRELAAHENGQLSSSQDSSEHPLTESTRHRYMSTAYDHLPAPALPAAENGGKGYYRYRSASDVSSHHVRPLVRPHRTKGEEYTASEVVPRQHASAENHYSSLQKRKRSALSLADPADMLKYTHAAAAGGVGGGGGLQDSSEFTRCLTADEIAGLNQPRPAATSPSERFRLFSFGKRNLRLPFSKGKGKRDKDLRDRLVSPEEQQGSLGQASNKHRRHSPTSAKSAHFQEKVEGPKRNSKYPVALSHQFKPTTASKFSVYTCATCSKGFTGFMKQALKCVDCNVVVHRHCEERAPACKAHIESGSYVTMSRKKVIHKPADLDDLGRFLLEKITVIVRDSSQSSVVDKVFKHSLKEFHTFLISTYSLSLQSSVEVSSDRDVSSGSKEEPKISLTFSQLVFNFDSIFRGIAKREGLNDPCHIAIGVNQIKTFLDEFGKARRSRKYSSNINPSALRRKTNSGTAIQPKVHKGHRFLPQQFKVPTICEHCSKAIPLLERGEVCEVCGCVYHEGCYRKVHKKCEGKPRSKDIPEYRSPDDKKSHSSQFGVSLRNLGPPNTIKVPAILETCFHHLEANGLYTQGLYRKSAGTSSKKAVRAALELEPEGANLESYSVHAVASAVGAFFRELPEPLLTWDMYVEFIRAMDLTNKKERQEMLHKLISRLPEINHAVFERLMFHLARVAQHEHINKMGPCNLAIIFAPCLLRGRETKKPDNPTDMLRDIQKQTSCLETIITEQMDKLTATIRGIRTLASFARETETKLGLLASLAEVPESATSTPSSTLKGSQHAGGKTRGERKGVLTAEERKRLTFTLEEIERERVGLAVNLTKLEPYNADGEEGEPADGDSDRWTPSSTPSPVGVSTTGPRGFSRAGAHRRRGQVSPLATSPSPPTTATLATTSRSPPTTPPTSSTATTSLFPLPSVLPTGPVLPSLTKNRVSHRPHVRPPTSSRPPAEVPPRRQAEALLLRVKGHHRAYPSSSESADDTNSASTPSDEELLFETTV